MVVADPRGGLPLPQEDLEPCPWLPTSASCMRRRISRSSACRCSGRARPRGLRVCGAQQASLDPFDLNRHIEEKLRAIYELAHRG